MYPLHYETSVAFEAPAEWSERRASFLEAVREDFEANHFEFESIDQGLEGTVNAFGPVPGPPVRFGHVGRMKIEVNETCRETIEVAVKLSFPWAAIGAVGSWVVFSVPLLATRFYQALLPVGAALVLCLLMPWPFEFATAWYVRYRISEVWRERFGTDS